MIGLPFGKPGKFWKGNIHTHSTRSDGKLTPSEVVAAYRSRGYDFLAITDHFMERFGWPIVDTTSFRSAEFTTLIGAELHAGQIENGERWHLLAVGLPLNFVPTPETETAPELANRAREAGAFVAIAHPSWYSLQLDEAMTIDAAHAVEIYNHTSTFHNDRGESFYLSDQFAAAGRRHSTIAVDDAHFSTRPDGFGAWLQVLSESLDPESLLTALKAGEFYSSQGPELRDVRLAGGEIHIQCSPVEAIYVGGKGSIARHVRGQGITEAAFPLEPFAANYFRVTVIDDRGKRAWSNPVWFG